MDKIGFKNFRKFTNFPEIDLGDITILVGGNNAGKSTLVKAILLMRDFLHSNVVVNKINKNNPLMPIFKFDTEHVSVGSFNRAFCRNSAQNEDTLSFTIGLQEFVIHLCIRGTKDALDLSFVEEIEIHDSISNTRMRVNYVTNEMSVHFGSSKKDLEIVDNMIELERRSAELNAKINQSNNLDEISKIKDELDYITKQMLAIKSKTIQIDETVLFDLPTNITTGVFRSNRLLPQIVLYPSVYCNLETVGDKRSKKYKEDESKKNFLSAKDDLFRVISNRLSRAIYRNSIEYIYAHSVSQQVFYNIVKDSNDYVTRTIHDFYQSRINEGDDEFLFLQQWLEKFEIGKSIEIKQYAGEAYRVLIKDDENGVDLADKGMGSIQMTVLLLRIATFIRKYKDADLSILLEEPEQNLHPALQSLLAELFKEVHKTYGFKFIVETHSEYMVRHIQVLTVQHFKDGFEESPFRVIYFTKDEKEPCYDMGFQKNGKFEREFGPGFFNVADDAAMELFDLDEED